MPPHCTKKASCRSPKLIRSFAENGGKILVCSPCFNKRGLPADQLIEGATIVGGAVLVEFMSQGAASISY